MNNTQELNSFLSIPEDKSGSQGPVALSPQRSLSPSFINSDPLQQHTLSAQQQQQGTATGGLGSYRRARAGTLPSRLYSSNLAPPSSASSASSSHNLSPNDQLDPGSLNFESLSISSLSNSLELPVPQPNTRLRSGSLLGLSETNSIWGVDAASANPQPSSSALLPSLDIPLQATPLNQTTPVQISPPNGPSFVQNNTLLSDAQNSANRARAYSTNNLSTNEPNNHYLLQNYLLNEAKAPLQQEPSLNGGLKAFTNDAAVRPRAQTIQNGVNDPLSSIYTLQNHSINEIPEANFARHQVSSQLPGHQRTPSSLASMGQPLLLDNIDPRLLNWTSTYVDSNLGPTNTLHLSKLPSQSITPFALATVLVRFGKVCTIRLFIGNESALIEYDSIQSAMQAKVQLHHQELLPGHPVLVTFAKILPSELHSSQSTEPPSQAQQQQPVQHQLSSSSSFPQQIQINGETQEFIQPSVGHSNSNDFNTMVQEQPLQLPDLVDDIYDAVAKLGIPKNSGQIHTIIKNALAYQGFDTDFGPLPDPIPLKEFDAPKLRETRKSIDANSITQFEIEELSLAMLDELPELASDYLGNTVVQKLFEFSSDPVKHIMLKEVSPYLAQMGIHKNGTWSAQKIISVANSPIQKTLVAESLRPYCVPLLNDQFGNYVIQCSLKFGSPWNDFIFEAILAKFWLIVQNRFGARAIRACLESHEATPQQTAIVSAAIILHARYLAINQNSALLITWFLDTCTLPNRYILLAPRLISHLGQLCTHKLASLTILKILNNRYEIEARNMIFNALFGPVTSNTVSNSGELPNPPEVLSEILRDSLHGASFVQKIVSNSQFEGEIRKNIVAQVRRVLLELNVGSYQGYKRLLDEVGLGNGNSGRNENNRHQRSHSSNNNIINGNGMQQRNKNRSSNGGNLVSGKQSNPNHFNNGRSPNDFRGVTGQPQTNISQFITSSNTPEFEYGQQPQHQQQQFYGGNPIHQPQPYYANSNNNENNFLQFDNASNTSNTGYFNNAPLQYNQQQQQQYGRFDQQQQHAFMGNFPPNGALAQPQQHYFGQPQQTLQPQQFNYGAQF